MLAQDAILKLRRHIWRRLKRPGPPPGITLEYAGDLFERGLEFVERGQPKKALDIARELQSYRYTGAYEVEAAALFELGDAEGAIGALRRGLDKMPVWRNGHRLATYLSDEGRYDDALEAFEASLGMYEPRPKTTAYNQAIVYHRLGNSDRAIELLESVVSADDATEEPEAIELASSFLTKLRENPKAPTPRRHSRVRWR